MAAEPLTGGGAQANANGNNNENGGLFDSIMPYLRMFLIWYGIQTVIGGFLNPSPVVNGPNPVTSDDPPQQQQAGHDVHIASGMDQSKMQSQPHVTLRNAFAAHDAMTLRVYVTPSEQFEFAADTHQDQEQLRWLVHNLPYSMYGKVESAYTPKSSVAPSSLSLSSLMNWPSAWEKEVFVNVTVNEHLLQNGTMFAHVFLTKEGFSPNPQDATYDEAATMYQKASLVAYRPPQKKVTKRNLLGEQPAPAPEQQQQEQQEGEDEDDEESSKYVAMWKSEVLINFVCDNTVFSSQMAPPPFMDKYLVTLEDRHLYVPALFINEFWLLDRKLHAINNTITSLPLQLRIYGLPLYKFALYENMQQSFELQLSTGTLRRKDMEQMKAMFLETNPILLGVTFTVSLLHSLFDFLAFKNDVSFWKNKKTFEGISLRMVLVNFFFHVVIFLYLADNETSYMILVSQFIGLCIEFWKLTKVFRVTKDATTQKWTLETIKHNQEETETAKHDQVAVAHLCMIMYPMIIGFSLYRLAFAQHKSWRSWILTSLTSFVYAFGFIMMTPQLYINYKLKSVAHLPWRTMVYKFLNTIIDDLFAFVIQMPWMHRLSCFRDDLIFLIYLYQRWIYPVDPTRVNEYGQGGDKVAQEQPTKLSELPPQEHEHAKPDDQSTSPATSGDVSEPDTKPDEAIQQDAAESASQYLYGPRHRSKLGKQDS